MKTNPTTLASLCGGLLLLTAACAAHAGLEPVLYSDTVLADNPIAYWRFNETVDYPPPVLSTNLGSFGAPGNGSYNGAVTPQQPGALVGSTDKAISVAGAGKIDVPWAAELNPADPFTVELWVKPNAKPNAGSFSCPAASVDLGAGRSGFIIYQSGAGTWQFRLGNAGGYIATADGGSFTLGSWSHLVGVYDGSSALLYVNGELAASVATSAAFAPNPTKALSIGARYDSAFFFNGSVDEVAIYPAVLGDDVIAAHYANGIATSPAKAYDALVLESSPLGYWRLDEPAQPAPPVAKNSGTLGAAADGGYVGGATAADVAPRGPDFHGFEDDNKALDLNGTSAYVGTFKSLLNGRKTFTVSGWIRRAGPQANRTGLFGQNDLFEFGYISDKTLEAWTDGGLDLTPAPFADEEWAHVAVVSEAGQITMYTNGIAAITRTQSLPADNGFFFNIGGGGVFDGAGNFFKGQIDEVALWDRPLLPEQIASHYFTAVDSAPIALRDPVGTNVFAGSTVTIASGIAGSPPLTYAWFRDGTPVAGATGPTLVIQGITVAQAGTYTVQVDNLQGSVTSAGAEVVVNPEEVPSITADPQPLVLFPGYNARFSVRAAGGNAFSYQWEFNEKAIAGATGDTYTRASVASADAGSYRVIVSNSTGSVTSAPAALTLVAPAPGTYAAAVAASRPIAYYPLNESEGPIAFDYAGGNNALQNGVFPGAVEGPRSPDFPGFGDDNKAAAFNGSDTYLSTGVALLNNRPAFTLAGWVNPAGAQANRTGLWGQNDAVEYGFIDAGTVEIYTAGGGSLDVPYPFDPGQWHFIVTVAGPTGVSTYLDGVLAGTDPTATLDYGSSSFSFNIGGGGVFDATGNFFNGLIDSVAVYDRALSASEIGAQYLAATGTPPSINATVEAGKLKLSWPTGTLESADSIAPGATWTPVAGAVSPLSVPLADPQRFYRLRL